MWRRLRRRQRKLTLVSSAQYRLWFRHIDAQTVTTCVREALKNGVAIGAHQLSDRDNLDGRRWFAADGTPERCTKSARWGHCSGAGGVMRHVKPHGMLYNRGGEFPSGARALRKRYTTMIRH
ncbi:LamB/YcsF family protein [Salmonella enterica subsp. enterica serovar Weltevreden]|nr:LamB/YcsF family protein [Salmonella enterica subsp. enterica serovar Weltevreden]